MHLSCCTKVEAEKRYITIRPARNGNFEEKYPQTEARSTLHMLSGWGDPEAVGNRVVVELPFGPVKLEVALWTWAA